MNGYDVKWENFYGEVKPKRISLPIYPFHGDVLWIPEHKKPDHTSVSTDIIRYLHPLLHENTSSFGKQCYTSYYTGDEFFLRDYIVQGKKMMPEAAYLELARAAFCDAMKIKPKTNIALSFFNVIWVCPLVVEEKKSKVHIQLQRTKHESVSFEIFHEEKHEADSKALHSKGNIRIAEVNNEHTRNIDVYKKTCNRNVVHANEIYEMYRRIGIDYGESFKGIDKVYLGENYLMSELVIPDHILDTFQSFGLHLSLLNSALQAAIILEMEDECSLEEQKTPFSIEQLNVYRECSGKMWAYAYYSSERSSSDRIKEINVEILDSQGNLCIDIKNFSTRDRSRFGLIEKDTETKEVLFIPDLKEERSTPTKKSKMLEKINEEEIKSQKVEVDQNNNRKIQYVIIQIVSELLEAKMTDIDIHTKLSDYGFDSILLTQLANDLDDSFNIDLIPAIFIEYATIAELSNYISENKI